MQEDFTHVRVGQPVRISAPTWNMMLDTARAFKQSKLNGGPKQVFEFGWPDTIRIYNDTGSNLDQFNIAGFGASGGGYATTGPLIVPGTNLNEFKKRLLLWCASPVWSGQFAVTIDAIPIGGIGRAVISGVVPAQVDVTDSSHSYADGNGDIAKLTSFLSGSARILWREANTTGVMWCLVRLGMQPDGQMAIGNKVLGSANSKPLVADAGGNLAQVTPAADGTYASPTSITIQNGIITAIS